MPDKKPLFLLLDGNALLHRAWHALPPLTTSDGRVVHAAYGFSMIMEKLLDQLKPEYTAVAWDLPGKTFRHEAFKAYKAQREKKEPELYEQIPIIQNILREYGVRSVSKEGFEADDVIATLSKKAESHKVKTLIATGDMDSFQLVSELTQILTFKTGISETKTYDLAAIKERFGLTPEQLIDYKALRGDPSDNIPGVKGIGEKTAAELILKFQGIKGLYRALKAGEVPEKYAKKLEGTEKIAEEAYSLVKLVRDVPLGTLDFADLKRKEPDVEALKRIFRDLQFKSLLRKYEGTAAGEVIAGAPKKIKKELKSGGCTMTKDEKDVTEQLKYFEKAETLGIVIQEGPKTLFDNGALTFAAVSDGRACVIIPLPKVAELEELLHVLEKSKTVVIHDLKKLFHLLDRSKIEVAPWTKLPWFDLMISGYLLTSGERDHDLDQIADHYGKFSLPSLPNGAVGKTGREAVSKIVTSLITLHDALKNELEKDNLLKLFKEIEMPLAPILFRMEKDGIELDAEFMKDLSKEFEKELGALTKKIFKAADGEFNIQSPQQLAEVLFDKLKLPTKGLKKTKSGVSTAAPELEKIYEEHEIIPSIMEYRELAKLQNTYVEALPQLIAKDGRVHTTFNQTVTSTGRLSSSDPNLQNIPTKTELGQKIRHAFVAGRGKVLLSADYSQIELRLMAIVAKDESWIKAFKKGEDIHTHTASEVWGIPDCEVTKEQRSAAKAINFGILYGMGPRSLARSTGLTLEEAKKFIDKYFEVHPAIKKYLEKTKRQAHELGYVETLFGRRRHLPDINSGVQMLVSTAERMATNMPLQGTAADLLKMAMIQIDGWLQTMAKSEKKKDAEPRIKMLLQVHDELVFEVDEDYVKQAAASVKKLMETAASFEVPMIVEVEVGKNWGELEALEKK
ncbi:MAG: DNA polymerase I [Patescibacteria group bacterium]|jgi:DNA polymerase-1